MWGGCWCTWFTPDCAEYGPPEELPNIYHRREYDATSVRSPDYRLTCFFIDKRYRRRGMSGIALRGALELIGSASHLYNGTRTLFERAGFTYDRPKGQFNCVMSTTVAPAG